MRVYTNSVLELSGGNWRYDPFRHTRVWVPDSPAVVECAFDDPEEKRPHYPEKWVPCPTCDGVKTVRAKTCRKCMARRPINHGTSGGFQKHIKRGEEPCAPCIEARRVYQAADKAKRISNQTNTKDAAA